MWTRSVVVDHPTVWHTFVSPCGKKFEFRDLPQDRFNEAVTLMKDYYITEAPIPKALNLQSDPESIEGYVDVWRSSMDQRMAIGCFTSENSELVGVNFLFVKSKNSDAMIFRGQITQMHSRVYDCLVESFNVYDRFGVDFYMTAYGMVVAKEYRSKGIGMEFLKARIQVMKVFGIGVTCTLFSSAIAQKAADRAGYEVFCECDYEKLARKGFPFHGIETKSAKLMGVELLNSNKL